MVAMVVCMLLASTLAAHAQGVEVGVTGGFGGVGAEGLSYRNFGVIGGEICGFCNRGISIFGEYSHWLPTKDDLATRITSFDLAAGGVRIQGGRRVRPFFDFGVAGGTDRYAYSGGTGSHTNWGVVLGGGAAIPLGEKFYVRPQFRIFALSGIHVLTAGSVGFGIRF